MMNENKPKKEETTKRLFPLFLNGNPELFVAHALPVKCTPFILQ